MIQLQFRNWQAKIMPEQGMNTVLLTCDGEHILRNPEGVTDAGVSCLHGTPLLLPPNRTEFGRFSFAGKEYQLPVNEGLRENHLHGFLRFQAFTVMEQSQTHAVAVYENRGEIFPFPFEIRVTCRLDEDGYHQEFAITNTGSSAMPLAFGVHSNFEEKDYFRIPLEKQFLLNERFIPQGEPVELDDRQKLYRDGMRPDGGDVDGFYTSGGNTARIGRMEYTVSENFNQWILYNRGGNQGFISIEPQCGAVNSLNNGRGLHRLATGETETFRTLIRIAE